MEKFDINKPGFARHCFFFDAGKSGTAAAMVVLVTEAIFRKVVSRSANAAKRDEQACWASNWSAGTTSVKLDKLNV